MFDVGLEKCQAVFFDKNETKYTTWVGVSSSERGFADVKIV